MMNFDATSREFCTVRRIRTNTPLQALTTLNDEGFFEMAQALAKRIVREGGGDDRARVNYGFRLTTGRLPKPGEADSILSWIEREKQTGSKRRTGEARARLQSSWSISLRPVSQRTAKPDEALRKNSDMNDGKLQRITRRHFFGATGFGIGSLALAATMNDTLFAADSLPGGLHHAAKAKSIIFLFMAGAPSQLDLFDYKPKLNQFDGQPCPEELIKGERFAFIKGVPKLLGSPHVFGKHGERCAELSNLLPQLGTVVDDIAIVKSMRTTQFNHAPAQILMNTGHHTPGRPSMGSWLTYGIGSEGKDLPGLWSCSPDRTLPMAARAVGEAASCPPLIRASNSAVRAIRCYSSRTPTG
jgi:hypothetical protein